MSLDRQQQPDEPSVARLAAGAAWHTTEWAVATGFGIGRRLFRAASSPTEAIDFASDVATAAKVLVNGVAEVAGGALKPSDDTASSSEPPVPPLRTSNPLTHSSRRDAATPVALRKAGRGLLEKSRNVCDDSTGNPASGRVLPQLAPHRG